MARFTHPGAGNGSGLPGPQGDPGPAGADGSNGADGADALWNYLGEYNGGLIYTTGDVVTYNGQLWYRNVYTSAGYVPGGVEGYWDLLAAKGADGTDGADGADGAPGGFGYYGSFYDVQTQAVTEAQQSTGVPVLIRNIDSDATNGFTIIDNSKMKATNAGVYNFAFSFQFHNTGGGGNGTTVEVWFTKNGTAIPDSNTRVTVNTNSPYVVAAWNLFQKLNANDYVQMYWATDNHHIQLTHNTGTMGGPAIPSAIITVNQVG